MRITEFLRAEAIDPSLSATTKDGVIAALAKCLNRSSPNISEARFLSVLSEREKLGSTGMEKGVAIPHARMAELSTITAAFAVSKEGVEFDARDGKRSHFFFALVAPENAAGLHLKALAKLSRLFRSDQFRDELLTMSVSSALLARIAQEDERA